MATIININLRGWLRFSPGGNPIKLQNSLKIFVLAKTIFVLVLAKTKKILVKNPSYKKLFSCLF